MTTDKRITSHTWWTATYRVVVDNLTFSTYTTCSNTRISTFLIWTSFSQITICVNRAFWSTRRWTTNISTNTRTYGLTIYFSTLTVWSTRWWFAWLRNNLFWNYKKIYYYMYYIIIVIIFYYLAILVDTV